MNTGNQDPKSCFRKNVVVARSNLKAERKCRGIGGEENEAGPQQGADTQLL